MARFTPMMEQYFEIKNQYKYCLLFFRLGDFYELFYEDAIIASKELEIVLTGKDCGQEERAPMCGVPYHAVDGYIARLVEKGYKVAICEQTEDPKATKTIVKREVVRVVTPGTVLDTNVLDEGKNNYIMCIFQDKRGYGLAVADVTTGEFLATSVSYDDESRISDEIARFGPAEIIVNEGFECKAEPSFAVKLARYAAWAFYPANALKGLCGHFRTLNLKGFGIEDTDREVPAAGALLEYLNETQKNALSHITVLRKYSTEKYMILDISSRRNLELTETIREKSKKHSLLWVLDKTKTAMGARMLRKWIQQPLLDVDEIRLRLDAVGEFKEAPLLREEMKELLNTIFDIERIVSKLVYASANGRDLIALKNSLIYLPHIRTLLGNFRSKLAISIYNTFDELEDVCRLIEDSIVEEPPFNVREGGIIRDGYHSGLDEIRYGKQNGASMLMEMEASEREKTGIKNLRIRFNKVFGYFIEITNSYKDMAPAHYIRRQTLANCERYTTEELKKIEDAILGADEKLTVLEYALFVEIREKIATQIPRLQFAAQIISTIDVVQSLGDVADKNNYCMPQVDNSGVINIVQGRHPVVELMTSQLASARTPNYGFVPNDTYLDTDQDRLAIITGPNMAGKSTYMRQVALITLMAQIGSFIPADSGRIGVVDRIFTRVGASDDLATGQSTFMVEMSEVGNILNNATNGSLIILDEIGRGTSTFDGLSIAWSVLEHIADKKKLGGKTLFATHYHELTELEGKVDGVKNYSVTVQEMGDDIIFLRKIARGGVDNSYGIHVARLAGLPRDVLERADQILKALNRADIVKRTDEPDQPEPVFSYSKHRRRKNDDMIIIQEMLEF